MPVLAQLRDVNEADAEVARTNPASRRAVEKAGFVVQGEEGGYLVFELRARP